MEYQNGLGGASKPYSAATSPTGCSIVIRWWLSGMRTGTALGEIVEELSYFGLLEHCATLGIDNSQVAGTITHLRAMTVHGADYWFPRRASL